MSSAAATPIDRATKLALVATGLAIFVVANDFTVTGGRLADLLGRRRIFVTGARIFAGWFVVLVFVGRGTPTTMPTPQPMGGTT